MIRIASLALLLAAACGSSKSEGNQDKSPPAGGTETVKVPVDNAPGSKGGATVGQAPTVDDPKKHLQPDEGTMEIGKAEGKAGSEVVAMIKVTPATGYHVSTDFPTELTLEPPAGVKLAKATFTAGKGQQGDADKLTEQALQLSVKATPEKAGAYEIKGWFKFGVCDKESCHPKKQPIAIQVAAN
jgi:hypothetical protein